MEPVRENATLSQKPLISVTPLPITMTHRLSLEDWLARCNFAYIPSGLTPNRMRDFMTYPFPDMGTAVEIPGDSEIVVACRLNRPASGHEIIQIRMTHMYYKVNFDQMLSTLLEHPGFYDGKEVLNVDIVLEDDCGVKSMTQIVTGETERKNRYRELRLVDPDTVWPEGTYFLAHTNPNPARKFADMTKLQRQNKIKLQRFFNLRNLIPQAFQPAAEGGA
jgi:hypothetical protein